MDILTTRIATLSQKPEFSSDEYKKWVEQDDFIQFLQALPSLDEMLLYASASYVFLYSVLVPTRPLQMGMSFISVDEMQIELSYFRKRRIGLSGP
jgi:hypothetical protein